MASVARDRMKTLLDRLGLSRPQARAWAMYDWANSAFYTTIITAVFPVYFLDVVAKDLDRDFAQGRYAWATTIALVAIALLAPLLGVFGDVSALRKRLLGGFVALGGLATAGLFFVQAGDVTLALVLFGLGNLGAAGGAIFYDSLLPHVARKGEMDQLSASAYALGYLGGGLLLALNLAWILAPERFGLPAGEGLSAAEATLPTRLAFLSVAVWWLAFSVPLFRRVREPAAAPVDAADGGSLLKATVRTLLQTLGELKRYKHASWMLLAFLVYNDGVVTVIRVAGLYATGKDLDRSVVIGTILAVQFVGVPFAFLFGMLASRFGVRRLILFALGVYALICVFAYSMESNSDFVLLGILVGMVQGGLQALSRSVFGSMIPKHKSGEFFALFAVGEKFAGILGPLLFALTISFTGEARYAILAVIVFFVVGALIFRRVDIAAGRAVAEADDREHAALAVTR